MRSIGNARSEMRRSAELVAMQQLQARSVVCESVGAYGHGYSLSHTIPLAWTRCPANETGPYYAVGMGSVPYAFTGVLFDCFALAKRPILRNDRPIGRRRERLRTNADYVNIV